MQKAASMPSITSGASRSKPRTLQTVSSTPSLRGCTVYLDGQELRLTEDFLDDHPGGREIVLMLAGRDCSREFEEAGHSASARRWARHFAVGQATRGAKAETHTVVSAAGGGQPFWLASRASALLTAIWNEMLGSGKDELVLAGKQPAFLEDGLPLALGLISLTSACAAWRLRALAWS